MNSGDPRPRYADGLPGEPAIVGVFEDTTASRVASAQAGSHDASRVSNTSGARRAIWVLLAGCLLMAIGAEAAARLGFHRASRVQRRFITEYARARTIGVDRRAGTALVIGNSLLLEGVRFDRLQQTLSPEWHAERLVLERTAYYDWYYGLKRLLRDGARPQTVVVVLTARQWAENEFRGDFSSHYLVGAGDLPELSRELGWSSTELSGAFVAHVSEFWAERAELRNFLLASLVPGIDRLTNVFTTTPRLPPLRAATIEPLLRRRIERLQALVGAYGARLVLVIPPTPPVPDNDGWIGVVRAARALHVAMVEPLPPDAFSPHEYRDGFHLNEAGADRYTSLLAPALREVLRTTGDAPIVSSSGRVPPFVLGGAADAVRRRS
jgi:hypothetical protein